mgnify:CR=1 FL=1|jgi:hypothetical protein
MSSKLNQAATASLTFRPASYWEDLGPLAALLRNVTGTNRRQMITDYWNAGKIDELDPAHLEDDTEPKLRSFLESIHPSFMGGEYLPDLLVSEVEIARIELQSTTADVICIRARKQPGDDLIHYRIVDEYESGYVAKPDSSEHPLTLEELINLIGSTSDGDLGICFNDHNLEGSGDPGSLRHFTTVSSPFYPGLFDHYDALHKQWVKDALETQAEEEEEDDED